MSTAELKEKLIAQISDTDNDELLNEISTMLYVESKSVDGVYQMSDAEIDAVEDGLNQIKNGQWVSDEEANREWKNGCESSMVYSGKARTTRNSRILE